MFCTCQLASLFIHFSIILSYLWSADEVASSIADALVTRERDKRSANVQSSFCDVEVHKLYKAYLFAINNVTHRVHDMNNSHGV
jgi:hypothetical protein